MEASATSLPPDCSGCFRLERLPGGTCTHWKVPPFHLREEIGARATARRGPKPCWDILCLAFMRYAFLLKPAAHASPDCRVEPWLKLSFRTEHLVLENWPRLFLATGTGLSYARLHEVASAIAAVAA